MVLPYYIELQGGFILQKWSMTVVQGLHYTVAVSVLGVGSLLAHGGLRAHNDDDDESDLYTA